jgi:hypothetical protein
MTDIPYTKSKIISIIQPEIKLIWLQIKSEKKLKKLCRLLNIIEEEFWIKTTRITLDDCFVCPRIDMNNIWKTEMEKLIKWMVK